MKEYAMLAALGHGPRSGYDLNRWFEEVASHFCTAGYSSVYPALARFEEDGLVVHETVPSGKGPERKVYSLTSEGWTALLEWTTTPAKAPETRDEQLVKALNYGMLPGAAARRLIYQARRSHAEKLAYYEERTRGLEERRDQGEISTEAYIGTRLTLIRAITAEESYVRWCDEALAFLASESGGLELQPEAMG